MNSAEYTALALRRAGARLVVLVVVLGVVAGALFAAQALMTLFFSAFGGSARACDIVDAPSAPVPDHAGSATDEQRRNATMIVGVGRRMQVPERGQWIALATAMQESGLRNIHHGDRDSLGLFQQRPSQGWGSPAQVTDPEYAAAQFYDRLLAVPGWTEMPLWQAAQTVQRSAFPTAYSKWEKFAAKLLSELDDGVTLTGIDACTPYGVTDPAPRPSPGGGSGCSMDDPTSNGCLTPATRHGLDEVERVFGGYRGGSRILAAGCWDEHVWNPSSDHPRGRACDFFPGAAGQFAANRQLESGWEVASWFRTHADVLQVSYIIWQGRIWTAGEADSPSGWGNPYTGGGVYDPEEPTGGHFDHLHVSFRR